MILVCPYISFTLIQGFQNLGCAIFVGGKVTKLGIKLELCYILFHEKRFHGYHCLSLFGSLVLAYQHLCPALLWVDQARRPRSIHTPQILLT